MVMERYGLTLEALEKSINYRLSIELM